MKNIQFYLVCVAALLITGNIKAQTADEMVSRHIDAMGGKEKISQIKSVYLENNMVIMNNDAPNVVYILNGKGYKSETEFNGQKMIICYTDKSGWSTSPMGGGSAETMPEQQFKSGKDQVEVGGSLFDYAAKGSKIELQGKEGGLFKIKLTSKDSIESYYFIDAATYYVTKAVKKGNMMGQEMEIVIRLSDYRKTDSGLVLPYAYEIDFGGQFSLKSTVKKVEINKAIDPGIFDMPK